MVSIEEAEETNTIMAARSIELLTFSSPELNAIKPDSFPTFYSPKQEIPGLAEGIRKIGGDTIEMALGYGSTFSGVGAKDSLMDILLVVRNPGLFYSRATEANNLKLGTLNSPAFHTVWDLIKTNFHLGTIDLEGKPHGVKLGILDHHEFIRQARGGLPGVSNSKDYLYLAGRLHKAVLSPVIVDTTPREQQEIDLAINQARIHAAWLTLGLIPRYFEFDQFAEKYTNLSYAADGRVEKKGKSKSLLNNNYPLYQEMLSPILDRLIEFGVIEVVNENIFEKRKSLSEEEVRKWLKKCKHHSMIVNILENTWTMGIGVGIGYEYRKIKRAKQLGWLPPFGNK